MSSSSRAAMIADSSVSSGSARFLSINSRRYLTNAITASSAKFCVPIPAM
jgi:hypothetical protein